MIKTERQFNLMCKSRGFARLAPRLYARCIGDGIYQTIYTGFKKYLDPASPNYSAENRKSYYISIGLRSMYSHHNEDVFVPDKNPGGFRPADLKANGKYVGIFNGIEEEYGIMEEIGFDILDTIDTQESLLDWWSKVQIIDTGRRIHDIRLVEPFLLCGYVHEAEVEISVSFIQGMSAYMDYKNRVEAGLQEKYLPYEQRIWKGAEKEMTLWHWCMGRKYDDFSSYINENYSRNVCWLHKYEIPIVRHTRQRILSKSTFYTSFHESQ